MDCRPAIPRVEIHRPLVSAITVADVLAIGLNRVDELIETGELRWAFNIACKSSRRRLVRVLAQSLAEHQANASAPPAETKEEFPSVVRSIFPAVASKAGIVAKAQASYVAQQLAVTSEHIFHLIGDGAMCLMRGTNCRRGPGGSPDVEFASVATFLQERRIL